MKPQMNNFYKKLISAFERLTNPLRGIWPRFSEASLGFLAILIVVFAMLTQSQTVIRYFGKITYGNKYAALIEGYANPFRTRRALLNSGIPIYDVKISRQEYAKLENVAAEALRQGFMSTDMKAWADAKFIHDGQAYSIKMRLRGDLPNHWNAKKKSWAIKFGNENIQENGEVVKAPKHFQGKRRINLIIPRDRDFAVAPFVNEIMREKGLVVPRDQFVVLRINGTLQGLYYEVENIDKPMFAAQLRPETPVLGQNKRAMHFDQYSKYGTPGTADAKYNMSSVGRSVDEESSFGSRAMQVLMAHSLNPTPDSFKRVQSVLDWDKYLQFRAVTTLFNTNHVRFGSDNLKLYFDPSRGQLEPVPWDVHLVKMPVEPGTIDFFNDHGPDELQRSTLTDPLARLRRNEVIWDLIEDEGELLSTFDAIHNRLRPLAWSDVLCTPIQGYKMDVLRKEFVHNVRRVYKVLSHSSGNLTYRLEGNDQATLDFNATNFCGISLRKIEITEPTIDGDYQLYEDLNDNGKLDDNDPLVSVQQARGETVVFDLDHAVLPDVKYDAGEVDGRRWEYFDTVTGRRTFFLKGKLAAPNRDILLWQPPKITVSAVNAVTDQALKCGPVNEAEPLLEHTFGIVAYDSSAFYDVDAVQLTLSEFLESHPEFSESIDRPGAVELTDQVSIRGTVIVPSAVPLNVRAGTHITMAPNANVVCFGGLTCIGTAKQPIRISAEDPNQPWGTFSVVRPAEEVVMEFTEISGGGQAVVNEILFTGGFAVYNANLRLKNCQVRSMRSEDGINLKNGDLLMEDCQIVDSSSDAIDVDFGTGTIVNCRFENIAGDGVDMSGSQLTVSECTFENVADKGTSVGENSHPLLINNLYHRCGIGVSTKDLSHAKVAHCTFANNKIAIEAKRKKPMFGPGSGEFVNCVFADNEVFKSEDYYSRGNVKIESCLINSELNESGCQFSQIQFADLETGDYRLNADLDLGGLQMARPVWMASDERQQSFTHPGISPQFGQAPSEEL